MNDVAGAMTYLYLYCVSESQRITKKSERCVSFTNSSFCVMLHVHIIVWVKLKCSGGKGTKKMVNYERFAPKKWWRKPVCHTLVCNNATPKAAS